MLQPVKSQVGRRSELNSSSPVAGAVCADKTDKVSCLTQLGSSRIGDTTSVISTGGVPYDTRSRTALVSPYAKQQWGYDAINSTWKGFFWSASGPALFKFVLTFHLDYHLVFNEDISFAQIVPSVILLGTRIFLPTSLFDFPMEWMGQESWERTTRLLGVFPTKLGDYYLRRIINGDGSKGYWFDKGWLTDRGGAPVAVGVQTFSD
eukprot:jgi/Botrbrau1/1462/Bobra.178_3s0019.2